MLLVLKLTSITTPTLCGLAPSARNMEVLCQTAAEGKERTSAEGWSCLRRNLNQLIVALKESVDSSTLTISQAPSDLFSSPPVENCALQQ